MRGSPAPDVARAALVIAVILVACGSRTGLLVPDIVDGPFFDKGYCKAGDPGFVYLDGRRAFQCSLLEQCEERKGGALCVNPCLDSLGNDTSNGCEFYAVEMDTTDEAVGVCYAVFIVNEWKSGAAARIAVDLGGQMLPVDQFARLPSGHGTGVSYAAYDSMRGLPAGEVAILFLSRDPTWVTDPVPNDPRVLANCPPGVTPAVQGDAALHGTGTGNAFHIKTNVPVVAYQMLPYGGGSARVTGSTLLLPTSAWDTNYVVANAYSAPPMIPKPRAGPTAVVIASQDGTHVSLRPTSDVVPGGGLQGTPAGVSTTYTLSRGQYLQFTQPSELTGSAVQSDLPVAVIGGSDNAASISLHAALGFQHAGVLPAVGRKFDRWIDTVLMQRPLGPGASTPAA